MKRGHDDAIGRHGPHTYADAALLHVPDELCRALEALRGPTSGPAELLPEPMRRSNGRGGTEHCVRVSAWGYGAPLAARHLRELTTALERRLAALAGVRVRAYIAMTTATAGRTYIGALVTEAAWDSAEAYETPGADDADDCGTPKRQRRDSDDNDDDDDGRSPARRLLALVTGL